MGAIQFIENLDRTSLTVSDEEFEKRVEEAVSVITERHQQASVPNTLTFQPTNHVQISEKGTISQPQVARNSIEAESRSPRVSGNSNLAGNGQPVEEKNPMNGLLKTIQRPLSSLGKILTDESSNKVNPKPQAPPQPPRRLSPAMFQPPRHSEEHERPSPQFSAAEQTSLSQSKTLRAEDAAARQASAEAAEAQRIQQAEHNNVVE
ncbi:uncharacterized protein KY384_002210 [Bacidia gigantensis]|uniref:uncharacterized protein n=1 Tax=Bacidia gigantensis TaxID=2732470 RepID=UPI001D0465D5|nr:uncharacterized protein KY384_002210 [Bacidia gigantensis]KAG8533427.1 hypothetical protein KY384_002210 [Bacidia gigantensis]